MVDVNLKVPALEKLIDYTASGIGAVAGPMLAPWKARKEAKARLIAARAEADSGRLIAQAQSAARQFLVESDGASAGMLEIDIGSVRQRIEFQEQKRQANIAATAQKAATELGNKEVTDHEPDPDWTARFFGYVQDVSAEDTQKLWAMVLSGEIQGPGTTSLRTLDVLKNMTSEEATKFQAICSYVIHDFVFRSDELQTNHPALSFGNLLLLEDAGLINANSTLVKIIEVNQQPILNSLRYQNWILGISATNRTAQVHVPIYLLTPAGRELYGLAERTPQTNYLRSLSSFLSGRKCELSIAPIIEELPSGGVKFGRFSPVEPDDQYSVEARP